MNSMKFIAASVSFAAAFILSVGVARVIQPVPVVEVQYVPQVVYREVPRVMTPLEAIIWQDHKNGENRVDVGDEAAESVMEYWQASSSIDVSQTPRDFQDAWKAHMKAWKNYADYRMSVERGEIDRSASRARDFNAEISRTWNEVLRIGRSHGAEID